VTATTTLQEVRFVADAALVRFDDLERAAARWRVPALIPREHTGAKRSTF
jgi:hypothetical protein